MKTKNILALILFISTSVCGCAATEKIIHKDYTFEIIPFDTLERKGGVFSSEIPEWVCERRVFSDVKWMWVLSSDQVVITTMEKVGGLIFLIEVGIWNVEAGRVVFYFGSPINTDKPKKVYDVVRVWRGGKKGSVILVEDQILRESTDARQIWVSSVGLVEGEKSIDRGKLILEALNKTGS